MKKITTLLMITFSLSSFADQCQMVSGMMAKRAELLLQKGAEIVELCEPCGETIGNTSVSKVMSARASKSGYQNYSVVMINGRPVDLAYTFVKVSPKSFVNVAKVIGCKAQSVSDIVYR